MANTEIKRTSINQVVYDGKTYTCNGERIMLEGQVRWMFRTKKGLDYDILVCDDRYSEKPEFTHITRFPGGSYTEPVEPQEQPKYLTFTAGEGGASVGFIVNSEGYELPETYMAPSLQYSTDGGKTWQDYNVLISENAADADVIDLEEGESVMFKGVNENLAYYFADEGEWVHVQAYVGGSVAASGDVTSLLNGVGGDAPLVIRCYESLFHNCTGLTVAPELPSTTLAENCYSSMFYGCTSLAEAPVLPATTLVRGCYSMMFYGCTSLAEAPVLPVTTLADYCYSGMFWECAGLTAAPALPATTLAVRCYSNMFSGCTSLTEAPVLPATTLADYCYSGMFKKCTGLTTVPVLTATTLAIECYSFMFEDCTSLTEAPVLPATTLANKCYDSIFKGCAGIISHDVATLNSSTFVFDGNSSCASLTMHDDTPPTIADSTIAGLKADCVICVPAASVDAYKAKQYWSARSAYIQAIQ